MCCESNFSAYDDGMYIKITVKNNKVSLFVNFNASRFFTDTDDSCGIYGARPQCLLKLNPEIKDLFEFKFEDFELVDYDPWPTIKAPIAV